MDCAGRDITIQGCAHAGELILNFLMNEINFTMTRVEETTHIRFPDRPTAVRTYGSLVQYLWEVGYRINPKDQLPAVYFSDPVSQLVH
jgi:hypothetical protein